MAVYLADLPLPRSMWEHAHAWESWSRVVDRNRDLWRSHAAGEWSGRPTWDKLGTLTADRHEALQRAIQALPPPESYPPDDDCLREWPHLLSHTAGDPPAATLWCVPGRPPLDEPAGLQEPFLSLARMFEL